MVTPTHFDLLPLDVSHSLLTGNAFETLTGTWF